MERLTYTDKDGGVCCPWERNSVNGSYDIWDEEGLIKQLNRLAAFEDIMGNEYDLDHLRELVQAEQAGRLVVLPWAAGDVIFEADQEHGVVKHTFVGEPAWMMHSYAVDDAGNEWYDGWGSSDETPFYKTREEAEEALAGKVGEA